MEELVNEEYELYLLANHVEDDIANKAMKKLHAMDNTWHWCGEFDDLPVSKKTAEWKYCTCFEEEIK